MNAEFKGKLTREEFIKNLDEAEKLINELNAHWDKVIADLSERFPEKKAEYEKNRTSLSA